MRFIAPSLFLQRTKYLEGKKNSIAAGFCSKKEVFQPHLPVRLPCYDFVPITDPTLGSSLLAVGPLTLGVTDFRDVTGGVYKARERIHGGVLIHHY